MNDRTPSNNDKERRFGTQPDDLPRGASLRDPRRHFDAAIEQIKDYAIFSTDPAGCATTWNEGVARLLGFSEAEFIGQDVTEAIFTPEAIADGVPARELTQAAETGQANNDRWMRRKDGSAFFAAGVTTGIRDEEGRLIGYVKVMRDQTQWKQLQGQLQRTVDELAQADQQRTEFLAVLAHELRNPLAPLRNSVHILPRVLGIPERVESVVAVMNRQITQMGRLIDDLLDISRITRGRIDLKRSTVDLSSIIRDAIETRPQCERNGLELTVTLSAKPLPVNGDATRLTQLVVNLIDNACKFTPRDGHIWVSTEAEADEAVLRVRDTGIGITLDEQAKVFEMFRQVDSSMERSRGGLGIGLTLVRALAELHGGSVQVQSAGLGEGSEFIVRLPVVQKGTENARGKTTLLPQGKGKRVLVVDDNEDAALTLATLLELKGHEVMVAHNGFQALQLAATQQPDLIVLDIGMPEMNGYDVAQRIRQQQGVVRPVLVALTGWGQAEDRRRSLDVGFDAHLVKPVDPLVLDQLLLAPPEQ